MGIRSLSEKFFLVSRAPGNRYNDPKGYGIWLLDAFGNRVLIHQDPSMSCFQPMLLAPRPLVPELPALSRETGAEKDEATVLLVDLYRGLQGVEPGAIKYLRVMEQIPRSWVASQVQSNESVPDQTVAVSLHTHIWIAVLLGIVPVEDDGSGRFIQKRGWHPRAACFNAMLVDIHGVHREQRPGSGPEGMQLLRLAGFHDFGAPCIPFDVFVPRPSEATGLLVSSAGACTHQAYAAFPRMETGRLLQGHACAVAVHHALADGVPVHEVDVRKVQLTGLELHGQSLVYLDDAMAGTRWHMIDQMLAARRVPERNDQGVFQNEAGLTVPEALGCLTSLFRDYTERAAEPRQLQAALAALRTPAGSHVSRGQLLRALTAAAGLVFQASDARHMQRFLLQARGSAVEARIDSLVQGERTQEERWLVPTMKRGLTLRVVAKGGNMLYFLDGKRIKRLLRPHSPVATLVGLVNGGEASRFDNLEVRVPENE